MTRGSQAPRSMRLKLVSLVAGAGFLFGGGIGCDPDVQAVLVSGLEAATVAVIEGLFQTVTPDGAPDVVVPTVMLDNVRSLLG